MLVRGLAAGRTTGEARRSPRATAGVGSPFLTAPADATAAPRPAAGPAPLGALAGVLAAQELADRDAQRRRALKRGGRLLERLDALRLTLLEGRPTSELQQALSGLLREPADRLGGGALAGVVGEIELRAAVELAKLERDAALDGGETRR